MSNMTPFSTVYDVRVDPRRGHLTVTGPNGVLGPARTSLLLEGGRAVNVLKGARLAVTATSMEIRFRCGAIAGVISISACDETWLAIDVALTNRSRTDVRIAHLDLLRLEIAKGFAFGGTPRGLRMLSNPRGMGYFAGTRDLVPSKQPDLYDLGPVRPNGGQSYERWNQSWMMTAVWDKPSRRGVVIGAAQPMHESLQFLTDAGVFHARLFADSRLVAPEATVHAPQVQINLVEAPREGIEAYGEINQQDLKGQQLSDYAGWNSFDYYLNTERLQDIVENADAIAASPALRDSIKWICVDSGWEYRWGEYVAVEHRFPGGLPNLVRQLRRRGLKTGIWTAPLMVERWSTRTTRWDPEALVQDEKGNFLAVFNDNCFLIDPTHPAGERYLRDLYAGLYRAGIRYFKCDFLEMGFSHGRHRFKKHMSLTDVNRRVLEIIREAIGPKSFLVACIEAPEAAVGICDAIRISGDMHNLWACAQYSALNTAWRWWMHGRLFWNDPDMIPVRGPETADVRTGAYRVEVPYKFLRGDSGTLFNRREAELWMAFCLLSGGLFSLCDRIDSLSAPGRRIIATALANRSQVAGKPVDFYEGGLPALYLQQDGPVTRLGVFNWYDTPRTIQVHTDGLLDVPAGTIMTEIWSKSTRIWKGPFSVTVPAHGCLYYRFKNTSRMG